MAASSQEGSSLAPVLQGLLRIGFGFGGLVSVATGIWMLVAPGNWFEVFPGNVPDTGPLNEHFIRDLGGFYVSGGILLLFALTNPARYGGVALVVSLVAYGAHAAIHVADLLTGRLGAEHWVIDAPLVFAPVIAWAVLLWVWWSLQAERHPRLGPAPAAGTEGEEDTEEVPTEPRSEER